MPQYGRQRTNPYYPGGGQEVSPEILGGMAYNPYSERTDIGFALRNALNNLLATRQMQGEQAREEEERQKKELQQEFENQIKERDIAVKEREKPQNMPDWLSKVDFLMKTEGITPSEAFNKVEKIKPEKTIEQIEGESTARARGQRKGSPPRPLKSSAYEMKKADIKKAVSDGLMSEQEGMQLLLGIAKNADDVSKGAAIRQANEKSVADVFNALSPKDLIKDAKEGAKTSGGNPPFTTEGYRMDMPRKYNIAKKNITDGVATPEDKAITERYDAIHRVFMERILPNYRKFDSFMKDASEFAKKLRSDKDFDLETLKNLFKIYGE